VIEIFVESMVTPVLTQGRMQEILMYGRELTHEDFIQDIDNAFFRFHEHSHSHAALAFSQPSFLICSAR
jgi:hypothetical protein